MITIMEAKANHSVMNYNHLAKLDHRRRPLSMKQLLILTTFITVIGARESKTGDDGGDSNGRVFRSAKNFDDAENRCRQNGAHLVSIHNEVENQLVHNLTSSGHSVMCWEGYVYIGFKKNFQTGDWYWTDGSKVDYTKWAPRLPDHPDTEGCAQLASS
ncbi:lectin C-type domain protein [Ancylostoma ceylanicum]|uniref:Lectin C-type domain protein n=1 Tax=Ancylostoma ceylanicum TaxID=53326 RepID=A0A0D6LM73_9BILA|nr:lectin C-type domain protein [Ancylostoma ceylanicum]